MHKVFETKNIFTFRKPSKLVKTQFVKQYDSIITIKKENSNKVL